MQIFNAYIDGFNLYKGALRSRPHLKWLDLISFCQALRPDMQLGTVYFFTSPIKERFPNDQAPRRQHAYLRVLENQGIRVVRGQFRKDQNWLRMTTTNLTHVIEPRLPKYFGLTQHALNVSARLSAPGNPQVHVYKMGEKGTDVNLASYLVRDACLGRIEAALVVTGDSDFVTPIKFAVEAGADVKVVAPNKFQKTASLKLAATHLQELHIAMLADHQLPNAFITSKGGNIVRPKIWR